MLFFPIGVMEVLQMKQIFGFIVILLAIPALLFSATKMLEEAAIATENDEKMEQAIDLPPIQTQLPVRLLDRNGELFSEEYVEWREPLTYEQFPQIVKDLFIYSEDVQFYDHIGFDVSAIARAVVANSSADSIEQGGSTITQQLVRMRYLEEDKSYERKLIELFYANELEKMYDKQQILEMYLNEMYFGYQVYGIGSASSFYFGKPLKDLTIAEAAFLAAIPNNPSLYNPVKRFNKTKARQERLLDTLVKNKVITKEEAAQEKQQKIVLDVKQKTQKYPEYSTYVLQEMRWLVSKQEGFDVAMKQAKSEADRQIIQQQIDATVNELLAQGAIIHTALDPEKQESNVAKVDAIMSHYPFEASATVIDNETREIVSIYAGKNYEKFNLHRAFQTPRQPGSTFKPLLDYAPAFETTTYTPSSSISGGYYCVGNFCPQNYGNYVYGIVSVSKAFSWSYNTSALRLLSAVGVDTAFGYIDRFNFRHITESDRNYAAALGGLTYGVTSAELADAYSSFVDGSYRQSHTIRKITDLDGNELYKWPNTSDNIWTVKTANYMKQLLNDAVRTGTARGISVNSSYVGAKTGTTNHYKDFWVAGLTNEYTAAVWTGYDKGKSMAPYENTKVHFKIFNAIMNP